MNRRSWCSTGRSRCRRLALEREERADLALGLDHLLYAVGAEGTDQLVLQVGDAHLETQGLQSGTGEAGAEPDPLQVVPEVPLLADVAESRQWEAEPRRAAHVQEAPDARRAAERYDRDALRVEVAAVARGQCLDRDLVAASLDEHDRTHTIGQFPRLHGCRVRPRSASTAHATTA